MSQLNLHGTILPRRIADLQPPYRYTLEDQCGDGQRTLVWCMLNPSTADALRDDPTSRKVAGFTKRADLSGRFGRWLIVNAYAYQATAPKDLWLARSKGVDVFGPRNHETLLRVSREHDHCVVAWGGNIERDHAQRVLAYLQHGPLKLWTLGPTRTKGGHPLHPLMPAYATPLIEWMSS